MDDANAFALLVEKNWSCAKNGLKMAMSKMDDDFRELKMDWKYKCGQIDPSEH